jgi:hypothetical protein
MMQEIYENRILLFYKFSGVNHVYSEKGGFSTKKTVESLMPSINHPGPSFTLSKVPDAKIFKSSPKSFMEFPMVFSFSIGSIF